MSFSKFTKKDRELIRHEYATLAQKARRRCKTDEEFDTVQRAFEFANEAHKDVRRRSGEPYIIHPIQVASIVVDDIGLGYKSICAALLHDVVKDTSYTIEDIRRLFGEKVASLVEGLTKIKTVLDSDNRDYLLSPESTQAENFKKILLTLNDDVRVVLIKLADRLHNCRTIASMPEHKRDKILSETMFIFIPLAHRLGLYEIKGEMENIWLRYKEPEAYAQISRRLDKHREDWEKELDRFITPISEQLKSAGFDFVIRKRIKSPYSIWHKMQTKGVSFEQIYDLCAVRIVFTPGQSSPETERVMCYHIYSIVTGIYRFRPDRVRDWVKNPKPNGYEALHCTLQSESGTWVEVQIRTKRMDDIAEKGIAAHWAYKREGYISEENSEMDKWLLRLKEVLTAEDSTMSAAELLDMIHDDLTVSEILVFTPKGDQRAVPKGATVLDFAYMIHTDIGNTAIAAKVNMKLSPLSRTLKTGDQVEIITAETGHPKKEWLGFLATRHAQNQAVDYFRRDFSYWRNEGEKIFSSLMKKEGRELSPKNLRHILYYTQSPGLDELYFRIGLGIVSTDTIVRSFTEWDIDRTSSMVVKSQSSGKRKYLIASCCNPIPGDPILGFESPDGNSIIVHKKVCPMAQGMASKHGELVVSCDWSDISPSEQFLVRISLRGIDRLGLLSDITHYISQVMEVNMKQLVLNTRDSIFEGFIEMYVSNGKVLSKMIKQLSSIDGIEDVVRSDI